MNKSSQLPFWNGLAHLLCDRPDLFQRLIQHQPDARKAWMLDASGLRGCGWPASFARHFLSSRSTFHLEQAFGRLKKCSIELLTIHDPRYPPLLRQISVPPQVIYVRGAVEPLHSSTLLSVVGSRHITSYGKEAVRLLLPSAVNAGATLVSGLAYGVDAQAHWTTVEAHRPTIAVLGGGIDDQTLHPKCNVRLAQFILANGGTLLSEYPPGTPAQKHRFPQRNRIIAGLSSATLVIEAAERSGSLITARLALEENREVWAVPGNINQPMSAGCNNLIAQGAMPIRTCQELCDRLSLTSVHQTRNEAVTGATEEEQQILRALSAQPLRVDKLFEICRLDIATFHQTLSQLELDGKILKEGERISLSTS